MSILNAPAERPILEVALAGGFVLLGEEPDRELLLGAVITAPPDVVRSARRRNVPALDPSLFRTRGRPGFARAVMNDPGSWIIRWSWLRAIEARLGS